MTTQTQTTTVGTATTRLINNEVLIGTVKSGFIRDGKLLGAVLAFEGKSETALLHRKQMSGNGDRDRRLAALKIGEPVTVRLIVTEEEPNRRKTWASEVGIDSEVLVSRLLEEKGQTLKASVVNVAEYGIFVDLEEGVGAGRRGLIHSKNMSKTTSTSLGALMSYQKGDTLSVELLGARVDEKGTLRIDLGLVSED